MQSTIGRLTLPITLTVLGLSSLAQAADKASASAHVEGGYQHNSNVTIDELNSSSGNSDQAWVFDAGLEGVLKPTKALNLTLGYSLSGQRYETQDEFDQDSHLLSADLSYDFDPVTLGTRYYYSHNTLGSDPFLDYRRADVYLGGMASDSVYLTVSLQKKTKEFDDSNARDSDIRGASFDSFFFYDNQGSFLLLGLDGDREDARADAYDSRLFRVRTAWVNKFQLGGEENRFRLGFRYEDRDYDQARVAGSDPFLTDPLTGDLAQRSDGNRADKARIVKASWRLGLNPVFSLEPSVEYGDYSSNVDNADYDQWVAGVRLRADF